MRVVICDDHVMFGEALQTVLERRGWTVRLTSRPDDAVAVVAEGGADVVVMDLSFPDADGVDGVRQAMATDPTVKLVLLTASTDVARLREAIAAGVVAVISKGQPVAEIVRVIERVRAGEVALSSDLLRAALRTSAREDPRRLWEFLTDRERQVLAALVRGESTRQIAADMGIAYSTARTHIQSVLDKLGVHSRLEASAFAVRHRMVDIT